MLTIFSTPKPFLGHIDVIQRNALQSWKRLHPDVEIILFGDDNGAAEVCRDRGGEGVRHFVPVGATEARVGSGAAEAAEVAEVELVQRDRAHQRELFALETAQAVRRRTRVERGKLAADGVQRSHGVPVVVFVVTDHHLFRDSVERRRAYGDRGDFLGHGRIPSA